MTASELILTRAAFLVAADSAAELLADPAIAGQWTAPSALEGFTIGGLAAHLASQVTNADRALSGETPDLEPVTLLEHYARSAWVAAPLDDEANVGIRDGGEAAAAVGPRALIDQVRASAVRLRDALGSEPADRTVHMGWWQWTLSLDDFLVTRMMEIAVHSDDLAVSAGIPTPDLAAAVTGPVLTLLSQLAARRHGTTAVLRALSRSERAPESISAF